MKEEKKIKERIIIPSSSIELYMLRFWNKILC